jgi:hypothetical protein
MFPIDKALTMYGYPFKAAYLYKAYWSLAKYIIRIGTKNTEIVQNILHIYSMISK